jgi:hypothetical protein
MTDGSDNCVGQKHDERGHQYPSNKDCCSGRHHVVPELGGYTCCTVAQVQSSNNRFSVRIPDFALQLYRLACSWSFLTIGRQYNLVGVKENEPLQIGILDTCLDQCIQRRIVIVVDVGASYLIDQGDQGCNLGFKGTLHQAFAFGHHKGTKTKEQDYCHQDSCSDEFGS